MTDLTAVLWTLAAVVAGVVCSRLMHSYAAYAAMRLGRVWRTCRRHAYSSADVPATAMSAIWCGSGPASSTLIPATTSHGSGPS